MKTTSKSSYIGIAADHRGCGFCACTYADSRYTITAFDWQRTTSLKWLQQKVGELSRLPNTKIVYPDLTIAKWIGKGTGYRELEPQLDPMTGLTCVFSATNEHQLVIEVGQKLLERELKALSDSKEEIPILSVAAIALIRSVGELYAYTRTNRASRPIANDSRLVKLRSY